MRLLFIHEINWASKVTYEVHELPERLSLRGHTIDFIDFPEAVKLRGFRRVFDLVTTTKVITGKTLKDSLVTVFTPGRVMAPPLDRLFASLTFMRVLSLKLRTEKYDAIILYAVPTNGWQTILLAKRYGVPVIFRGIDVAHLIRETRLKFLVRIAERYVYRNANHLSLNNPVLASYCLKEGADSNRISINLPGLDVDHFRPGLKNQSLLEQYDIASDDLVIVFLGTFFSFSGVDEVIMDFRSRVNLQPNLKLLLIGGGELDLQLSGMIKEFNLENSVIRTGFISYSDLPDYLRLADVAICPFKPEKVANHALPWKVMQYLGIGLPVVSRKLLGLEAVMDSSDGIQYVGSTHEMMDVVNVLLRSEEQRRELALRGNLFVRKNFDWVKAELEFENLISATIKKYANVSI